MRRNNFDLKAVDLFAGAGGLSLGFEKAEFKIFFAIENDFYCAETYNSNRKRKHSELILSDVSDVNFRKILKKYELKRGEIDILLCGAPCQGFSSSNLRTRNTKNPQNHLFKVFIRAVEEIHPKWILFENVSGIVQFEKGKVIKIMTAELSKRGYLCSIGIINAADYGVPQIRKRFFLIGNRKKIEFQFPLPIFGPGLKPYVSVREAISDLPLLENGNKVDSLLYRYNVSKLSYYQKVMRRKWKKNYCLNNKTTRNSDLVIKRYKFIPPGGNWQNIPDHLMKNYKNKINCHGGIYKRLKWDEPSIVISNFRKNMLIHPDQNRGLSVRESARLQTFNDDYIFYGPLTSQQQQVANSVPPLLSENIGKCIVKIIRGD